MASSTLACRLLTAVKAQVPGVTDVRIGVVATRSTWKVLPASFQAAAQATIDAFNPNDPALDVADLDAQVSAALDNERLFSAIVWAVLDTYSAPATIAKYTAARTKIIAAYKARPWVP